MRHPTVLVPFVLLVAGAVAQDNLGLLRNTGVSYSARGVGFAPAQMRSVQFNRIDTTSYGAWGFDPFTPGTRSFTGLHFRIQDFDQSTADPFRLVAYTELQPDFPDVANPLAMTGPISMPLGAPGLGAFDATANFATPIVAPATADVFVGLSQDDVVNFLATDGMTVWLTTAESGPGTLTVRDLPGAAEPAFSPANTVAGFFIPQLTTAPAYVPRAQFHIEPIVATAAGVASALHYNDSWHGEASAPPGTSCVLSSLFPDARSPSLNAGRADDLGMTFRMSSIPDLSPVLWLGQLSQVLPAEVPLAFALPGANGALGVDPTFAVILGVSTTTGGEATNVIVFPAALRPMLGGIAIVQQAVAYDWAAANFVAGPCPISTL
jgi:hypothetical protein